MSRFAVLALSLGLLICSACGHNAKYYLNKANTQVAKGKLPDAELNYRKAIQLDTENGEAYAQLGALLLKERKASDAWSTLSRAAELLPDRDDIAVQVADLSLNSYRADPRHPKALYDKANQLSDRLLARNAESFDGLRLKAGLATADMKYAEAEDLYSHANRVKPFQPELTLEWVGVLFRDNQAQQAESLAMQFIAESKSYGPIYDLLYAWYAGAKRPADAEKILQARVNNNPADAEGIFHLASFYASSSHETEMRAALQRMLGDRKDFPQAELGVGNFYASLRRWDDALTEYRQGARDDPKNKSTYQKRIVDALLAEGKGAQAEAIVDDILREHPDDESARAVKASFLIATRRPGDIDKAVTQLQDLVKKKPEDAERHFNLGRAMAAKGDLNGAVVQFQTAVGKQPRYIEPRVALIEISQARQDFKSTLRYADQLLALNPNLPRIRLARAAALMYTGQETESRREMETLARNYPKDPEIAFQMGMLDLHERRFSDAEAIFRKLTPEDGGDGRVLAALVQTLGAQNRVDDELAVIRQKIAKSPKSVVLHALLAKTAAETTHYDTAIEEYKQMLAAAPNSEQTALALGTTYRLKGDFADAVTYFEKAHELVPADPEPMLRIGGALALSGKEKEALDNYQRALKLKPEDPNLLNNTAYLIAETGGNLDEAAKMAQRALKLDSRQPNYTDTLGWIYLRRHLDEDAAQVFRGLTERYPNNPTFHYHLGMTLLQQGNKAGANSEFKSALARNPSDEIRARIQTALAKAS